MSALRRPHATGALAAIAVVGIVLFVVGVGGGPSAKAGRRSPTASWAPLPLVNLTGLMALPGTQAPPLTLTDQRAQRISVATLRGHVVVVEPMDPECTDVCPIVSQEFIDAARDLGSRASRVVFVAINVNQFHERVADVMRFSHEHRLDQLAHWHFLTGTTTQLRRAWRQYGIAIEPNPTGDVIHSDVMYFLDRQGHERWLAAPNHDKALIPQWGAAIARISEHLLGT